MIKELPEQSVWSVGGIGEHQLEMNAMSLVAGGGVRIGIEDNVYLDKDKKRLATNKELIERISIIAKTLGRKPYSRSETRGVLGI